MQVTKTKINYQHDYKYKATNGQRISVLVDSGLKSVNMDKKWVLDRITGAVATILEAANVNNVKGLIFPYNMSKKQVNIDADGVPGNVVDLRLPRTAHRLEPHGVRDRHQDSRRDANRVFISCQVIDRQDGVLYSPECTGDQFQVLASDRVLVPLRVVVLAHVVRLVRMCVEKYLLLPGRVYQSALVQAVAWGAASACGYVRVYGRVHGRGRVVDHGCVNVHAYDNAESMVIAWQRLVDGHLQGLVVKAVYHP
ncbi:MAG: hypothetical protein LQ346_008652 [Caloplaca aetnensis]|nr:MAG: hypothetical protein LQ346_008652 [Caloplaca aetnensis]